MFKNVIQIHKVFKSFRFLEHLGPQKLKKEKNFKLLKGESYFEAIVSRNKGLTEVLIYHE